MFNGNSFTTGTPSQSSCSPFCNAVFFVVISQPQRSFANCSRSNLTPQHAPYGPASPLLMKVYTSCWRTDISSNLKKNIPAATSVRNRAVWTKSHKGSKVRLDSLDYRLIFSWIATTSHRCRLTTKPIKRSASGEVSPS